MDAGGQATRPTEPPRQPAPPDPIEQLIQGAWRATAYSDIRMADDVKMLITISGREYRVAFFKAGESVGSQTSEFTLRPAQTAGVYEMNLVYRDGEDKGKTVLGPLSLAGSKLRVCLAEQPGMPRPQRFETAVDHNKREYVSGLLEAERDTTPDR